MRRMLAGLRQLSRDFATATTPRGGRDVLVQFSLMFGLYYLYRITRALAQGREAIAFDNADAVIRVERALGFYWEPWLQARFSSIEPLMSSMIWFYREAHLPAMMVCLAWVFMRRRDDWPRFRNWFLVAQPHRAHLLRPGADRAAAHAALVGRGRHGVPLPRRRGLRDRAQHLRQPLRGDAEPALRLRAVRGALRLRAGASALAASGRAGLSASCVCWRSSSRATTSSSTPSPAVSRPSSPGSSRSACRWSSRSASAPRPSVTTTGSGGRRGASPALAATGGG